MTAPVLPSPTSLARLVALNAANLPHSALVETPVTVYDAGGGAVQTYSTAATLPCRLSPNGVGAETIAADAVRAAAPWRVAFDARTAALVVTPATRLTVSGLTAGGQGFTQRINVTATNGAQARAVFVAYGVDA